MSSDKVEEKPARIWRARAHTETVTAEYLKDLTKHLQEENRLLKQELSKTKQAVTNKIGFAFLIMGIIAFFVSVVSSSSPLAFIGLGVTFWGAIFIFVRPVRFVKGYLLDWTAVSSYETTDRILEDLKYNGQGIYIPPFPKEVYLPEHLKSLKEIIVYITADDVSPQVVEKLPMPTLDEIARARFLLENPRGITIIPPGSGLMNIFENELKRDFSKVKVDYVQESFPRLLRDLGLAENVEMKKSHWLIEVTIRNSVYEDLYSPKRGLKSVHVVGCPLASAIACAFAKTTGKLVAIVKDQASPESHEVRIWYKMLES